ncbi:MAG: preprotein translocase subunit SecA [Alphaproteobacteria bacterium PRO2]|nr:preprotein translocase subunit SecA [Alphaproteobacteria bacterium PRO2]
MILNLATQIFGSSNGRKLKILGKHIAPINALEPRFEAMSDAELQSQTTLFRQRLANGEPLDGMLHEAFAVTREAAKRVLGQRHYDVQMIGGLVLHQGDIAEMKTGEGKTLVATLPVYLNALTGKGVHVVTVNDYLAKRDADWMGQIYRFMGLTTGCIVTNLSDQERRDAYAADVTYGTNNELGFDYLRDNMKYSLKQMVQRPFNFAIVDEVDSILIDEARTPLIISGPSELSTELYVSVNKLIPSLTAQDYEQDEKHKTVVLTEEGQERAEELLRQHGLLNEGSMYDIQNIALVHHVNQALRAHRLFHRDTDYIVKDDRVILIDEFTGRMMEGRRLSEGLHQAIEAKEGVRIQTENQTLASITFQNYFRLYPKLAGMTGTALTEAAEFQEIYNLGVVEIPTNVPVARLDYDDKIYKSLKEKDQAIIELIRDAQERQQPVLVGTVSIDKSEKLSDALKKVKIKHNVLNARYHEQEAQIIAQAGRPGAVTIATNMAGRGTDIQLGGNADMRIAHEIDPNLPENEWKSAADRIRSEVARDKQIVKEAGGLYVIGTERHESRRIDNQLRGRSGRQGDAGATMFFLSVEDDLMRIFAGDKLEALLGNKRIGLQEGEALEHPLISKMLQRAQAKVEGMHFEVRKNLLKFDNVMNDQRKVVYEQRREIMEADSIEDLVRDMRHQTIEDTVRATIPHGTYAEQWDINTLHAECMRLLGLDLPVADWAREEGIADEEIQERIIKAADEKFASKIANAGPENWRRVEKGIVLQIFDQHWKEHLLNLDHLRQGINLRAFGQRDPLNEYKTEAFGMFETMLGQMREAITMMLSLVEVNVGEDRIGVIMPGSAPPQKTQEGRQDPALMGTGPRAKQGAQQKRVEPFPQKRKFDKDDPETWGKVQRNADCPCGSGKKFKHCHGNIAQKA